MTYVPDASAPKPYGNFEPTARKSDLTLSKPQSIDQAKEGIKKSYSLDWKLIGIRTLNLFSGALLGIAIGAAIVVGVGLPVAGVLLLLSNPIGIGIAAVLVLIALTAAYKYGGAKEVMLSGALAGLGTVSGVLFGVGAAVSAVPLMVASAVWNVPLLIITTAFDISNLFRVQHHRLSNNLEAFADKPDLKNLILQDIDDLPKQQVNYHPKSRPTLLELAKRTGDQEIIDRLRKRGAIDEDRKTHASPNTGEEGIKFQDQDGV
jgi:hypothetical protein